MVLCDVNVWLYAFAASTPYHSTCRKAVQQLLDSGNRFGLSELAMAAVVRIATNRRVFSPPTTTESAFGYVQALRSHPHAVVVRPSERHWDIFRDLVTSADLKGPDTTDAYFAALAIEHGCDWWTTDSDFAKFSGLRWKNLLA